MRVCNGPETDRWEQERAPDTFDPHSMEQLLGLLSRDRQGDHMYVQLYREAPGATVRGLEISQAPASVLEVLEPTAKAGETTPTKGATLVEVPVDLGRVAVGCETKKITVVPYRAR